MSGPRVVRPFALVRGRTGTAVPLALESLVSSTPGGIGTTREMRDLVQLCRTTRSVAEVSALMSLPLAVAKVLVSDAREARLVDLTSPADASSESYLEEVLDAFRTF